MTAARHAQRIASGIAPEIAENLAKGPRRALEQDFGLTVRDVSALTDRRGADGWCDGFSFIEHSVVLVVPTSFSRRESFTLIHELAHRLVLEDDDALDWLSDEPDPDRACESLCDQIAARLLLPAQLIAATLGDAPPCAAHLAALYQASEASEPVCAIALAARLPCQGAVLISDIGGTTVTYASVNAPEDGGWPIAYPWPRRAIPSAHLLTRIAINESRRERSWWATSWGERQDYYLDSAAYSRRAHTVLAVSDLWGVSRLHVGDGPRTLARPERVLQCPCGYDGTVRGFPCKDCGQPYCPRCKECRCGREVNRLVDCPNPDCFLRVLPHQIHGSRCINCE